MSKWWHVAQCSLHCQIAKCVLFCRNQKNIRQWRPLPPEILAETDLPPPESSESWHVLPCSASTVRASEKSSFMTNRKSYMSIGPRWDAHLPSKANQPTGGYSTESVMYDQCNTRCTALPLPCSQYSFPIPLRAGGWIGPSGWLHTKMVYPQAVTHLNINQAQFKATSLMQSMPLPPGQT